MVTVRFFAGARAAAGAPETTVPAGRLGEIVDGLAARYGSDLARVLGGCSYLLDGTACHDRAHLVPDGSALDVLPPFAGG